ncbi:GntR family transcriptional regulator [Paraburkholderia silvatlantica]|uniref:GntR family transcriptional regulator n=3 Tax=Paraburkholderia silvatlantica TaxID=321895 RepID=A0A2U1AMN5_9BURK|nr:GntR family transcriptional regulator [Paraburkholderia silvatlantica]PXW42607.1 GntR family transcriptional regulator [Paraburkholderia silvatlantica]PYE24790.1 GntR family transcriptional regulator [Paraburkholderia silvatlantica]TDR04983.1 GntR family transcriptional regulator [Paraburkholderia silvatlantica]
MRDYDACMKASRTICEQLTKAKCEMNETGIASGQQEQSDLPALRGEDAYWRIRRDVLSCRFMPGATLTESQLMEHYGIGKSTCRVALVRLVHEGFIRAMPRQGYRVAPITLRDVEEVFALRVQLEPLAARLACGRVDVVLLRKLEAACRVPYPERELSDQIDVFLDANREFHLAIAQASGNVRLHHTLANLMDEMSRLVALGFGVQGTKPEIRHDHNSMIDAFETNDARRAETIARRHIETFRDMTMEKVYASLSSSGASLPVYTVAELRR